MTATTDPHTSPQASDAIPGTGNPQLRPVEADKIETELDTMWRDATAAALAHGHLAGSRNSVMTLVAYTYGDDQAMRVFRTVEDLTRMHPSRAIVVAADARKDGRPVEAFVATYTHDHMGTTSYGEKILLKAHDDAVAHIPGAVLPLVVSGLPSFLWWTADPPWRTEQLEALVDGSDRFVVDTSEMGTPERGLAALEDIVRRKQSSCAVSDFNWTRMAPWRDLVAGFFDGQAYRDYLFGIDRVTIEYAAGSEDASGNTAQAYLFAGWLASRLNWRMRGTPGMGAESSRTHQLTDPAGQRVELEINARYGVPLKSWIDIVPGQAAPGEECDVDPGTSEAPCVGPGALMTVYLHTRRGDQVATFTVAREHDMRHASTLARTPAGSPPSQTVHLPSVGESALLMDQLAILGHDAIFEEALKVAAQMLGPGNRR